MGAPIPLYEPLDSGASDNIFLSKSYDASSHFETTTGKNIPPEVSLPFANKSDRRCQGHLRQGRGPRAQGRGPQGRPEPRRRGVEATKIYPLIGIQT
jgi:hypothetical protein